MITEKERGYAVLEGTGTWFKAFGTRPGDAYREDGNVEPGVGVLMLGLCPPS